MATQKQKEARELAGALTQDAQRETQRGNYDAAEKLAREARDVRRSAR